MSVRLVQAEHAFAFGYRCDGGCRRPELIALTLPAGWETLRTTQGEVLCRCPGCRTKDPKKPASDQALMRMVQTRV